MAIRVRKIKGKLVALCAGATKPETGDIYLDDSIHHGLSEKFALDFESMGFLNCRAPVNWRSRKLIERIERGDYNGKCHKET